MSRPLYVVAALVILGGAGAWVWSSSSDEADGVEISAGGTGNKRVVRRTGSAGGAPRLADGDAGSVDVAPADPATFEVLPDAHSPAAIQKALEGFPDWLGGTWPEARATFLGADCAAPPCVLAVTYDAKGFAQPERMGEFLKAYQGEVERRVGFRMTMVSMEEDASGRPYVWMYAVPEEWPADDPVREDILADGAARHGKHMASLVAELVPAKPQLGEAGYVPE